MRYVRPPAVANEPPERAPSPVGPSDAELVAELARGNQEAAGPIYARYAPIVFGMARHAVDPAAAEEIVQDVFVRVWKSARTFDPARGSVRSWLLQIAHFRIANELRARRRRPAAAFVPDGDGEGGEIARLADELPGSDEELWRTYRARVLHSAMSELPPAQRQALGLSFFAELSHSQVAELLDLPIGTVKSRVRLALARLRGRLAAVSAATLALVLVVWGASRMGSELGRERRAVTLLTSSETEAIHAAAAPGAPPDAHATWRARRGSPIAVVTLSHFPPAAAGEVDRVWASLDGRWVLAGSARIGADGHALVVAEGPAFASRPAAIEVRRTAAGEGGASPPPSGLLLARWASTGP
jgi:RNA polymerase sigma-70 factor (ECF subfamily)